jgi:hypothetical protein
MMRYMTEDIVLELDAARCTDAAMRRGLPHAVFALRDGKAVDRGPGRLHAVRACSRNCGFGALRTEAGVGCASAVVIGALTGREPTCGGTEGSYVAGAEG